MTTKRRVKIEKDHPDQAVDTDLPGDTINEEAWQALVDNYEGDPEIDTEEADNG
jgi:hypothetical protein